MAKVDPKEVTVGEMVEIIDRYEVLIEMMLASNNTLVVKIAERDEATPEVIKILNDWSLFCRELQQHHLAEVNRLAAPAVPSHGSRVH